MIALLWLKSLLRTTAGRIAAMSVGVALAVSLMAMLGIFIASAADTMTARAVSNVPVDWQVEIAPGADRATIEQALAKATAVPTVRAVEYAKIDGFSATTGGTEQVTAAGQVIGIPADYLQNFPKQVTLLGGSLDGPVLFSQTAANLHAVVGNTVAIRRPGLAPVTVRVAGIAAIPNIDSLFQVVGMPPGLAPQSPPDNVMILSVDTWHSLFDAQRAARPDSTHTQLHVLLDRAALPRDPVGAYTQATQTANNFEASVAGSALVANNLAARLDGVRGDALYAKVLFLFLGAPGVILAGLVSAAVAGSGRARRRREQTLLRIRGANLAETLSSPAVEAGLVGGFGAAGGLALAFGILPLLGLSFGSAVTLGWGSAAAVAGFILAFVVVLLPAVHDSTATTVARARTHAEGASRPLWERLWLDALLLVLAGVVFWTVRGSGYQIVLASEGVAQTSVNYGAFLAPLLLWAGLGLLWVRLSRHALTSAPAVLDRAISPIAGDLAGTVRSSLSRQSSRIARGAGLLALAAGFAVSTAIFNTTYDRQSHVDAELTNGAAVNVTGPTADPAANQLQAIRRTSGVTAAEPMTHRYAYVGADLQDLYGIDPQTIGNATTLANAYFVGSDAKTALAALSSTPDGVLVSEETVRDFQLQPGDTVNLRLQTEADHQYHPIPFKFVGVAREFPTAPKDSFLVANAAYLQTVTGNPAQEVVLVRAADPAATADRLRAALSSHPSFTVTALGDVQSLISSSLTAVDLGALAKLELVFGLALIAVSAGLVLALGFAERQQTYSILKALGASPGQLGAFLRSEAALITVAGLGFGLVTGFGIAEMLVTMLAGVFDPPPEMIQVPFGYLGVTILGAVAAAAAVVVTFERLHGRTDPSALKPD
jgi:putative ABC transport system permease protein